MSRELRKPSVLNYRDIVERDKKEKERQAKNNDNRHGTRPLSPLTLGDTVYVQDRDGTGTVVQETTPHSYKVRMPEGTFHRKRHHIVRIPAEENNPENICDDLNQLQSSSGDSLTSKRQSSQVNLWPCT